MMSHDQKALLVSSLRSAWRAKPPRQRKVWSATELMLLLKEQESLLRNTPHEWTTGIIQTVFGRSFDMLQLGPSGMPHLHEAVVHMADFIFRKLRPALAKLDMPDTLAALVELDHAVAAMSGTSGQASKELLEVYARNWYVLCFSKDRQAAATVSRRIWEKMGGPVASLTTTSMSYLYHLALSPLERRRCSGPRTIAFMEALLSPLVEASVETRQRALKAAGQTQRNLNRTIWVLGASDAVEGTLAREGYFEDAGAFVSGSQLQLFLVADTTLEGEWPRGSAVQVHARTWEAQWLTEALPDPHLVFCMNTGLGTLSTPIVANWAPRLLQLLLWSLPTVLTCRCQAEVRGERSLLEALGAKLFMITSTPRHIRNLYSGMAADPDVEHDDNGWILAFSGSSLSETALRELLGNPEKLVSEASARLKTMSEGHSEGGGRTPAVFWGILDLKYDTGKSLDARVRILESGDGRSSRFSGYGAAIKETVQHDLKLGETLLRRSILVENKKLTHDLIVDSGYSHVRPIQVAYPRVYDSTLAWCIKRDLSLEDEDYCVLKLCNRQRGAGVIPIRVAELDEALEKLLVLPKDVEAWLAEQPKDWARHVHWGSFEEQLRHWWSNECPCFVVEELCCSQPTVIRRGGKDGQDVEVDAQGKPREFDGTMRVGFSLIKDEEPEGEESQNDSNQDAEEEAERPRERAKKPRRRRPEIFKDFGGLRVQWLGGYWKLPIEDTSSSDLRGRIVSVAKQGTAPVPLVELHDVYATLGDVVQAMFSLHDLSYRGLVSRYRQEPELGAFIVARLALSTKPRERDARSRLLGVAQTELRGLTGLPCDFVRSYVERGFGVSEAMFGNWEAAQPLFRRSVDSFPANSTARFLLGMCLMESGNQGNLKAAVARMEESLLLDPDFKAPYADIGVAHLRLADYEAAAEISQVGLSRHPATAHLEYNLACSKFVMACREEEAARAAGNRGHHATELRKEARQAFLAAREHRGKEQQWTDSDNDMVTALGNESRPLNWPASAMPRDGWRFLSWRQ